MHFQLFGTSGCHLCEQAEAIVGSAAADIPRPIAVESVDVCEPGREHWHDLYALKIPVLFNVESGKELFWPFTENEVAEFVADVSNLAMSNRD